MLSSLAPLLPQAPDVIHHLPHLGRANAGSSIQTFHGAGTAHAIANADEQFTISRSMIPFVVREIRWSNFVGSHCRGNGAHAVALLAVAFRA